MTDTTELTAWRSVAELYRHFFAGLVLRTVAQRGAKDAAELVFRTFRRQHHARFLPGLRKLGLDTLPDAVAAASYHYLSNRIGGVSVEFMPDSDRKAWVRFPPPRWVWPTVTICAIPTEVSAAMLRGWQAHNGVSLGNPRLGFVCTGMTPDGQPGLEGYFLEHDRELAPEERLRFARHESAPPFDPARAPKLDPVAWPAARLAKAHRGYAMEYVRSALPEVLQAFGPEATRFLAGGAARLVGMQMYPDTAAGLGITSEPGAAGFARFMVRLAEAQGDRAAMERNGAGFVVRQEGWALMRGVPEGGDVLLDCWAGLLEGAAMAHDRRMTVRREGFTWSIGG
ncbi:hypothetical protein [Rhodopila sp.]|uniref:hypothetical protein n=1 Tax=Rhodopila sp. TaxID=2480087 RepID=UPI002BF27309|nr:hypothetical protein [Rhodopila sp.]HVZ09538.1 hypothetical protein [Rhodopila sp.]